MKDKQWTIAYDPQLKRPGCAIIQAALGSTLPRNQFDKFDSHNWIASPTPGMALMRVTQEQLDQLIEMDRRSEDAV